MCAGDTMRSPAYGARRPEARLADADFHQLMAPESFTVLPAESARPAHEPYKLTPRTKRRKNQAFSIIAEPASHTSSRSTSPAGRVSPFRGRGFNATGSRHASPDRPAANKSRTSSTRVSHIPKPIRRRSSAEDLLAAVGAPPSPGASPPGHTSGGRGGGGGGGLRASPHSRSMTNIAPRHLVAKPPPSPRRAAHLKTSFVRLSPILGSSPGSASDQTVSSPSRIPRSKSQPPSRIMSPRPDALAAPAPASRSGSRPNSRPGSRPGSPTRIISPSKIPLKSSSYKHIPAKVDSFQRAAAAAKPKVPLKPKVYSTRATNADRAKSTILKKSAKARADDTETTDTDRDTVVRTTGRGLYSKPSGTRADATKRKDVRGRLAAGDRPSDRAGPSSRYASKESLRYASKENLHYDQNSGTEETEDTNYSKDSYGGDGGHENTEHASSLYSRERTRPDTSKTKETRSGERVASLYSRDRGRPDTSKPVGRRDDKPGAKTHDTNTTTTTTTTVSTTEELSRTEDESTEDGRDDDILSVTIDSLGPSTTQIVSATTETVTKPLNIEAKLLRPSELAPQTDTPVDNANAQKTSADANNTATYNLNIGPNVTNNRTGHAPSGGGGGGGGVAHPVNGNGAGVGIPVPVNGSLMATPTPTRTLGGDSSPLPPPPSAQKAASGGTNVSTPDDGTRNNNTKRVTHADLSSLEMNARNSLHSLAPAEPDKVSQKALLESPRLGGGGGGDRLRGTRAVIVDEIQPIKITVREKTADLEVQSGNFALPRNAANGLAERPLLPANNAQHNVSEQASVEAKKPGPCSRIFSCCNKSKEPHVQQPINQDEEAQHTEESVKRSFWRKLRCTRNKVTDSAKPAGCFQKFKRNKQSDEENWAERRDSILSEPPKKQGCCGRLKRVLSVPCCTQCRRKPAAESVSRRTSMLSKKKSLSSTMQTPPAPEDTRSKIDVSLVEHTSHMRGAIPVLPVPLAWICLMCNVFLPGFGTILSGLLCLCIGKPRFSPKDGIKPRIGAFLIDVIVGISQMFTVLFCLVGWGWSIWWGVIMLKVARKHKKIKLAERSQIEEQPAPNANHLSRDEGRAH